MEKLICGAKMYVSVISEKAKARFFFAGQFFCAFFYFFSKKNLMRLQRTVV